MSEETKRDVFDEVRRVALQDETLLRTANIHVLLKQDEEWHSRYEAALLDDLPAIPKAVGEYIKSNRTEPLGKVFWHLGCISVALLGSTRSYIVDHSEVFARAWLLGVWRVEETGEIVKLEAEK